MTLAKASQYSFWSGLMINLVAKLSDNYIKSVTTLIPWWMILMTNKIMLQNYRENKIYHNLSS